LHDPPLCSRQQLRDGTYTLDDLADMHECMDVEDEYRRRFEEAAKQKEPD
jgi:hypothetical protein